VSAVLFTVGAAWILVAALLVLVLLVQVAAGWRYRPRPPAQRDAPLPSYAVLMPAHNEAGTLTAPIQAVLQQLAPGARLLVVADNCCDTTAAEARAAGAQVVERHDLSARGKGHALAFGIAHLAIDPPQVLIVLDADCTAAPGTLDLLAATAMDSQRPVQALDLMLAAPGSSLRVRMAAFAWAVRNQVRPFGMHRLGLPCQLMGTGMAFPWPCVDGADFASGHLAEDQQLGLKLAASGRPPRMCPGALVESWFPQDAAALEGQRTRWEHGHLSLMASVAPLLWRALRTRNAAALALAIDLCIPPLALLAVLVIGAFGWGAWMAAGGGPGGIAAAVAAALAFAGFGVAALLAWASVGRRWVRLSELATAPVYVLKKIPLYAGFLFKRQKEWVRTSRQR
jgi:cellulose synthase/poly-beta-1,6-N-acetylglucosamine synthase-like glycosyltransferase